MIKIILKEKYKSFEKDFEIELDGTVSKNTEDKVVGIMVVDK